MLSGKLTVKRVAVERKVGLHGDGGGLYLQVSPGGSKQWILRTVVHGRRRDIGLGGVSYINLAAAREEARRLRAIARKGGDPLADRRREHMTFEDAARRVHAMHKRSWKNGKHQAQWINTLKTYAFPHVGAKRIDTVGTADVLTVLTPIWTEKHETATRVLQRLSAVFDWAKSAGHYPHENPVTGVRRALPRVRAEVSHHTALPWVELPGFMEALAAREAVSALCLRFLILTATRSGEAREARWSEIEGAVWTIPAVRMKAGKPHRIPLAAPALEVLDRVRGLDDNLLFPGQRAGKPLSNMVFKALFTRLGHDTLTAHGFRSTFRDWASERARAPREVAEAALAHTTGNAVEQAYARSDLFERRVELMEEWGRFANGTEAEIVSLAVAR